MTSFAIDPTTTSDTIDEVIRQAGEPIMLEPLEFESPGDEPDHVAGGETAVDDEESKEPIIRLSPQEERARQAAELRARLEAQGVLRKSDPKSHDLDLPEPRWSYDPAPSRGKAGGAPHDRHGRRHDKRHDRRHDKKALDPKAKRRRRRLRLLAAGVACLVLAGVITVFVARSRPTVAERTDQACSTFDRLTTDLAAGTIQPAQLQGRLADFARAAKGARATVAEAAADLKRRTPGTTEFQIDTVVLQGACGQ